MTPGWMVAGLASLAACASAGRPSPRPIARDAAPSCGAVVERRPYYVNFIPFGAGQFQNGHRGKGAAFAASQGVTAATSVAVWLALVHRYGYGGWVPRDEVGDARRLQRVGFAASVAFAGLAVWGVIDAVVHHEPEPRVTLDAGCLRVTPTFVGSGAGVAITWTR